jgi:hypothetical protein
MWYNSALRHVSPPRDPSPSLTTQQLAGPCPVTYDINKRLSFGSVAGDKTPMTKPAPAPGRSGGKQHAGGSVGRPPLSSGGKRRPAPTPEASIAPAVAPAPAAVAPAPAVVAPAPAVVAAPAPVAPAAVAAPAPVAPVVTAAPAPVAPVVTAAAAPVVAAAAAPVVAPVVANATPLAPAARRPLGVRADLAPPAAQTPDTRNALLDQGSAGGNRSLTPAAGPSPTMNTKAALADVMAMFASPMPWEKEAAAAATAVAEGSCAFAMPPPSDDAFGTSSSSSSSSAAAAPAAPEQAYLQRPAEAPAAATAASGAKMTNGDILKMARGAVEPAAVAPAPRSSGGGGFAVFCDDDQDDCNAAGSAATVNDENAPPAPKPASAAGTGGFAVFCDDDEEDDNVQASTAKAAPAVGMWQPAADAEFDDDEPPAAAPHAGEPAKESLRDLTTRVCFLSPPRLFFSIQNPSSSSHDRNKKKNSE